MSRTIPVSFKVNEEEKGRLDLAARRETNGNLAEFARESSLAMAQAKESGVDLLSLQVTAENLLEQVKTLRQKYDKEFAEIIRARAKLEDARERFEEEQGRFDRVRSG